MRLTVNGPERPELKSAKPTYFNVCFYVFDVTRVRLATFNVENLDTQDPSADDPDVPPLDERIPVVRPQLRRIDADVLCLQEVHAQGENPRELTALDRLVEGTQYADYERRVTTTDDGDPMDERNLVVLSRFPIERARQIDQSAGSGSPTPAYQPVTADPRPESAETVFWERPIFHVEIDLNGEPLHVLNVHLKSKNATDVEGQKVDRFTWKSAAGWAEGSFLSTIKRVGQALELRQVIDRLFDREDDPLIAACGDFNAGLDSVAVQAITGPRAELDNPALVPRVMVSCGESIPESERYTLLYQGEGELLDHVLVSRGLFEWYDGAEIHNETLSDESLPFRSDRLFPESDHAPFVARFDVPGSSE